MSARPFVRMPFAALPQRPRRPHVFDDAEGIELRLSSDNPFGRMRVHVRRYGSGPPLLLVHGLMTSSYSWRYAFAPLGEHYTCYAPDLPGAGRSARAVAVPYTPENLARWIAAVQRALGIRGGPVIGNSMGGYLCLHLALDDPSAMSRLVDLHSPGVPEPRLRALRAALALPGARALLRGLVRADPLRWAHRNVHYYDESLKSLEEAREYGDPLADRDGAQVLVKYLAEAMDPRPMQRLQRRLRARRDAGEAFPVPLLLMYAERDPMVPPRVGRVLAERIPSAELIWLKEASHFAHVDAVERFVPPALRFLRG